MSICKQYLNQFRKNTIDFYYCIQNPRRNLSIEKFHGFYIIQDGKNRFALYKIDNAIPLCKNLYSFSLSEIIKFKQDIIKNLEWI